MRTSTRGAQLCSPGGWPAPAACTTSPATLGRAAPRRSATPIRSAALWICPGVHGWALRSGAHPRKGGERLCDQRRVDRRGPPLGLARDGRGRDGVGLRDLPRSCDPGGRACPRSWCADRTRGERQRAHASGRARRTIRPGGVAGRRGRQRHRSHGHPSRALRCPGARRSSGPRVRRDRVDLNGPSRRSLRRNREQPSICTFGQGHFSSMASAIMRRR